MGHNSFLFKITSECNDFCSFCLEYKFIKSGRPPLSFEEFKKNYYYLKEKFRPNYAILTGGEPTLHPQFFEMLNFLKQQGEGFRFITNLLKFNQKDFLKNLKPIFSNFLNKKQENLSKIIASINDLPEKNQIAQKRFAGLTKALLMELPLMVTVVIYRDNLRDLPALSERLKKLFEKYLPDKSFHVEFRLIYIEGTSPKLLKLSLPTNFPKIKKAVEDSIQILDAPKTKVTLWNFPLCYLDDYKSAKNEAIAERQARRLVKIDKDNQLDKVGIREWEAYLKPHQECKKCQLKGLCSGIDEMYITEYGFPKLKPKL
ncbi:MAG: radical SAM protein [Candidatus Portnoybacteria bacterium]|nr:radical SAM protein [Candidatus Portnoybacteria bacterium]